MGGPRYREGDYRLRATISVIVVINTAYPRRSRPAETFRMSEPNLTGYGNLVRARRLRLTQLVRR